MGILVKLVGSGIGLASEAIHNHKAKSAAAKSASSSSSSSSALAPNGEGSSRSVQPEDRYDDASPQYAEVSDEHAEEMFARGQAVPVVDYKDHKQADGDEAEEDDDASSEEGDEEAWDLDDAAQAAISHTDSAEQRPVPEQQLIDTFMRSHPPPIYSPGKLPCPVILPQRRPRDKKRGFVRAYAPVLAGCGIDQQTFLDFLETFDKSAEASQWLQVINVAAMIAGNVPSAIAVGVSIAVQFAVGVAMEVQRRQRANSFLDRMNNEFFKPRGLYCLIMTYKPESSATHAPVDITQTIYSSMTPATSGFKRTLNNLRVSSGTTRGELEMPEAAPLIFPALDKLADQTGEGAAAKKENVFKRSGKFVADYQDRRAQAKYLAENPESSLAGPQPQFRSRYADPNHPANSGSLISLITGGHINPPKGRRRQDIRIARAHLRGEVITPQTGKRKEGLVKRILKKDVIYLMIVSIDLESAELQAGMRSVAEEGPQ